MRRETTVRTYSRTDDRHWTVSCASEDGPRSDEEDRSGRRERHGDRLPPTTLLFGVSTVNVYF